MLTLTALDAALAKFQADAAKFEVEVREVRASLATFLQEQASPEVEVPRRKVRQWRRVEGTELDQVLESLGRGERISVIARELGRPVSTIKRIQRKWQAEQQADRKVG